MKLKKFINECRENEVFKNLSIYIVSSWVLLQVVALVAEPLGLPEASLTYLLLFLLIGFPLYIYLIWKYQLRDKIKKKPIFDESGNPIPGKFAKSPFQKIYFSSLSIIAIIALGVALVVIDKKFVQDIYLPEIDASDKIAVLQFDNNTGDENFDIAGKMASDWIIHGITQNKLGQVISPDIIEDYSKVLRASIISPAESNTTVTDFLKPSKIIEGEYYLNRDRLIFQCSITDEIMNTTLISFSPVECDEDAPLDCIEALKQKILGYLVTEDKTIASLEDSPPSYKAYEYFNQAKIKYLKDPNDEESMRLVDQAIAADSTYFEPRAYKFQYYYNNGQYATADSLLKPLLESTGTYERQRVLLNIYEALLNGNYKKAHRYQKLEYNMTPFHLETNSNMMIMSLQLVNKPEEIDSVFNEIDMTGWDITNCNFCVERYKMKAMTAIQLKRYDEAIELLDDFSDEKGYTVLKQVLLRAYIRSENYAAADDLLSNIQLTLDNKEWYDVYLFAAKELLWMEKDNLAQIYLENITREVDATANDITDNQRMVLAETLFYLKDFAKAEKILEDLLLEYPDLIDYHALLAISYQKNGKTNEAGNQLDVLEDLRKPYQYGDLDYAFALYHASIEDENNTLKYLMKAVADGHWYETSSFQNDPLLKPYYESDGFKRILTFWH